MKSLNTVLTVICTVLVIISIFPGFGWLAYIYGAFATLMLIFGLLGGGRILLSIFFIVFAIIRLIGGGFIGI
ncbi:MAG: hypothetical protein LBR18_01745 [Tannerella sp.]|jgi:hypothetical protein|nr:hypothetical protein [Tannerella sp.]